VGVAVNVTEVPAHMVEADAAIETEGVSTGFTVMVMALDVAEAGEAQASEDVITQLTMSPFTNPEFAYVEELVPVLAPFSSH